MIINVFVPSFIENIHFTDARICRAQTTRLVERNVIGVTAYCTQKQQNINSFFQQNVYRINNITGMYRLSTRESHFCYDVQVLPNMTNLAELTGGKYYEIVYRT